jgi:16S rRNA (cytidine1402-2'-O)-methyltransferase
MNAGNLYIVSTPIGNLEDITLRAIKTLEYVDIVVCEDTRVSKKLLNHLGIKNKRLVSYNNYNENEKTSYIISLLEEGNNVALISDAGTPLISDPGFILVRELIQKNIKIEAIGGISAPIVALTLSGLPTNKFLFLGFLDKSSSKKKKLFEKYKNDDLTLIFFESPNRVQATLQDILEVLGENQEVVVARELTKLYEEIKTDTVCELINYYETKKPRGEMVVLLKPSLNTEYTLENIAELIKEHLSGDKSTKEISKDIANITGLSKNIVYDEVIKYKNQL